MNEHHEMNEQGFDDNQPKMRQVRLNLTEHADFTALPHVEQTDSQHVEQTDSKPLSETRKPKIKIKRMKEAVVAANGKSDDEVRVTKKHSVGSNRPGKTTESTLRTVFTTGLSKQGQWTLQDQKRLGARVYRVKGYTTQAKIRRKFSQEKQQRFLRNLLMVILFIVAVVILFVIYNPIKDIVDVRKMLGMESPFQSIPTLPPTETLPGIPQ